MWKVAVVGAGSWGTALSILLGRKALQDKLEIWLWSRRDELSKQISQTRRNEQYLPSVEIPKTVYVSSSIGEVSSNAQFVITAVPSQYLRNTLKSLSGHLREDAIICSVSKGIELQTFKRMSEVIHEETGLPRKNIAVLSGPSHAEEVAKCMATAVVVASTCEQTSASVQQLLHTDYFRIYTSRDVKGVEYGGALKNIIAIGAGICDGLSKQGRAGIGDNAKASLLTRGIEEMSRLGRMLGSNKRTFYGLSGWGDLLVTSYSGFSRNRFVGERLAMGIPYQEIQNELRGMIPEGVQTTKAVYELSKAIKVEMPITEQIYSILYEGKDIERAIKDLMTRSLKPEYGYYLRGITKRFKLALRKQERNIDET